MTRSRLGTVLTAMVTPFAPDGTIDFDVARDVATFLVAQGCDGLVVAGSTGEGSSLSDSEKLDLFACVAEAVSVPVIAGTTCADTSRSVELTSRAADTGVAAVLVTTPAYVRPSQAGMAAHFAAVAQSTVLPVMLYDVPSRTGRKIASATTIDVVRHHPNVVALKDASTDLVAAAHTQAVLGTKLDLYSGDDAMLLPFMALGAVGIVSVAAHWATPEFVGVVRNVECGDWDLARLLNERLAESCAFVTSDAAPNPIPAKAAMRVLGFAVGECRLPLGPSEPELEDRAREIIATLGAARG